MKIDNSFSPERIKKALGLRTILIVLAIVAALSTVFYVVKENTDKRELTIWFVTTESEAGFSEGTLKSVNDYTHGNGIDRTLILKRHPEDRYFDVVMSTGAFYNCDAFIMREEIALKYADMDMFLPLTPDGVDGEDLLLFGESAVGIKLDGDYYFLINRKTDIDTEIIYDIYRILAENKNEEKRFSRKNSDERSRERGLLVRQAPRKQSKAVFVYVKKQVFEDISQPSYDGPLLSPSCRLGRDHHSAFGLDIRPRSEGRYHPLR